MDARDNRWVSGSGGASAIGLSIKLTQAQCHLHGLAAQTPSWLHPCELVRRYHPEVFAGKSITLPMASRNARQGGMAASTSSTLGLHHVICCMAGFVGPPTRCFGCPIVVTQLAELVHSHMQEVHSHAVLTDHEHLLPFSLTYLASN